MRPVSRMLLTACCSATVAFALACLQAATAPSPDSTDVPGQDSPATPPPPPPLPPDTTPLSGVPIYPGESIQAKVNASPTGTAFVIKAGRHVRQSVTPRDGNAFIGEPGAVLDGENVTQYAIGTPSSTSRNVVVRGLVISGYAPPYNWAGAVGNDGAIDWLIENNEVRDNAATGVRAGPGTRVVGNYIRRNAVMGVSAYKAHGAVIENNRVVANAFTSDASAETATRSGMKIVSSERVIVRNNEVHDNGKYGIWFDIDCRYALIEGNRVTGNARAGIFYEISYDAVIRHNHVERNYVEGSNWVTAAGILIAASPNVEVYGNTVLDNGDGIVAFQMPRESGRYGPHEINNLYVHDNTIRMARGQTGLAQKVGDLSYFRSRNNRFERNTYSLGANAGYFTWNALYSLTVSQWQGYGQDVSGTFRR